MDAKLDEIKPVIRSILLALGRQTTEKKFRAEYYNQEGESFNKVLFEKKMNFYQFMRSIPDTCRVWDNGVEVFLERVSTEDSKHMDNLTINTTKRRLRPGMTAGFRPTYGGYRRPILGVNRNFQSFPQYTPQSNFNNFCYQQTQSYNHVPPPTSYYNNNINDLNRVYNHALTNAVTKNYLNFMFQSYQTATTNNLFIIPSQVTQTLPSPQVSQRIQTQNFVSPAVRKTGPVVAPRPLRNENWSSVINKQESSENSKISSNKESFQTEKQDSDEKIPEVVIKETRIPETVKKTIHEKEKHPSNPFAFYLKSKLESVNKSVDRVLKNPETISKPEVNSPKSEAKVAKFKESDIQKLPSPVKTSQKTKTTEPSINNYITEKHSIPKARMRQLKFLILLPIEIIEVRSLSYFIFQFNISELNLLHEEMKLHYKSLEESEHLSIKNLIPEMSVAVFVDNQWQRAETLLICPGKVLVRFVDTMTLKFVQPSQLRYLEKSFAVSPCKACQGSLAGVEPKYDQQSFSDEAIKKFKSKVLGIKTYAVIKGQENEVFKVSLLKDSVKRAKISDYLIAKGLVDAESRANMSVNGILI